MESFVRSEMGLDNDDEPMSQPTDINLFNAIPTALFLFSAWRKHGSTPRGGGLLDQPLTWRRDMEELNLHYNAAFERLQPEFENRFTAKKSERQQRSNHADFFALDDDETVHGWEDMING